MRTRVVAFVTLLILTLPLLAQEPKLVMTLQLSGEKAETISSFSWEVTRPALSSGDAGSVARANLSDLTFTRPVSSPTTSALEACAAGKRFAGAVLKVSGKKEKKDTVYMEVKLVDVVVSSVRVSGTEGDATETTTLSYAGLEYVVTAR
jgi:type VI protein secretion system component Hcp